MIGVPRLEMSRKKTGSDQPYQAFAEIVVLRKSDSRRLVPETCTAIGLMPYEDACGRLSLSSTLREDRR